MKKISGILLLLSMFTFVFVSNLDCAECQGKIRQLLRRLYQISTFCNKEMPQHIDSIKRQINKVQIELDNAHEEPVIKSMYDQIQLLKNELQQNDQELVRALEEGDKVTAELIGLLSNGNELNK